jgi:putative ABC transport system permease protein
MLQNYIKIAFRSFARRKLFTLINIIGLSVGISAALVIYLIVHFDFTFDKYHPGGNRIYRVVTNFSFSGNPAYNPGVCDPLPGAMNQVSGLSATAPVMVLPYADVTIPNSQSIFKKQDNVILADAGYFQIFDYKWLAGSAAGLSVPGQVVLTSDQAQKYFPGLSYGQILGRTLLYDTLKTIVTGIVQTPLQNTDLIFGSFISYATAFANPAMKAQLRLHNWGGTSVHHQFFVKLMPGTNTVIVQKQLNQILHENSPPYDKSNTQQFSLQPLADIHFNANYGTFNGRVANITTLYNLFAIALFILLLGCINFVNLSTAQSVQRAKEIGIRKAIGSSRWQLIFQFLAETFVLTLMAALISAALAPVLLNIFADFIPPGVNASLILRPGIVLFLLLLTALVSLLSGFYPALVLSGYKPVAVLKGQVKSENQSRNTAWFRKSLTVSQFIIAQFFIMATLLVNKQIHYALHKDIGFKKDAIILINAPAKNYSASRNRLFLHQLQTLPGVELAGIGRDAPMSDNTNTTEGTYKDGKREVKMTDLAEKFGDENYIKLYHIKLMSGRNLQPGDIGKAFIVNQTLTRRIGFKNPQDAVGKQIINFNGDANMQIIGVVADFNQESIIAPIAPLTILMDNGPGNAGTFHIALKPQTGDGSNWQQAINGMQREWKNVYPGEDFTYHFLDKNIAQLYITEQHTATLLNWATGLSVLISCLGLLGLAVYNTTKRTKEIGVRKVLGASVAQLVVLLSREMIGLILLAFIIVTPVAYWAMHKWMQNFADRTTISWWIFGVGGMAMLVAASTTSALQTVKAAMANPVKSLKSE